MKLAWQWENYGLTFPVQDMEAGLLKKMTVCLNTYRAVTMRNEFVFSKQKTDAEFRKSYPQYAVICKEVKELREAHVE